MFTAVAVMAVAGLAVPAAAQGYGHAHGGAVVVVGGGFYNPYYFSPWYGYQYPYPYPYPPYYGYHPVAPDSSMRLDVKPKEAEVYVDGYYAGVVNDFNGTFQRLRVEPGEHELELWLEGYRTVRQKVFLTPDNTFKVKYQMERLAAGETPEPKPQPPQQPQMQPQGGYPPPEGSYQPRPQSPIQQPPGQGPTTRRMPPPPPPPPDERRGGQGNAAYGSLAIRVQPGDAEVSIDGEAWRGSGSDRLVVEVAEGSHTIEIRKAGYRTYVTQIDVRRGQTTPLNVSLRGDQP